LMSVSRVGLPLSVFFFFFQAEDGIRDFHVTGVQTCALPIFNPAILISVQCYMWRSVLCSQPYLSCLGLQRRHCPPIRRPLLISRSEERRVGKEGRARWSRGRHIKKREETDGVGAPTKGCVQG